MLSPRHVNASAPSFFFFLLFFSLFPFPLPELELSKTSIAVTTTIIEAHQIYRLSEFSVLLSVPLIRMKSQHSACRVEKPIIPLSGTKF